MRSLRSAVFRRLFRQKLCLILMCCLSYGKLLPTSGLAEELVVLRGARLIEGTGAEPREGQDLVLQGEKILRIEPTGKTTGQTTGGEVRVIDLRGKTILPGLICAHAHIGQVDGISRKPENYNQANILRQLQQYEAYGVTTVVALGANRPLFYEIREQMHAGQAAGADLFGADRGIGVRGGVPSGQALPAAADLVERPQTAEQAREVVRAAKQRGTDLIKMWLDDARGTAPKMSAEVYTAVIEEAHKQGIRVTAHIFNLVDAKALVRAGVDVIAHGVRDQPVDREFIELMKTHEVWYIPTLALDEAAFIYADRPEWMEAPFFQHSLQPELKEQFDDADWREKQLADPNLKLSREALAMNQRNLAILAEAGVNIGFGTDSGATPQRIPGFAEHRELFLMVQSGLEPLQVLTIATGHSAKLLELKDRGTLAAGQQADLLILDADPTIEIQNTHQIHSVWHRGEQTHGAITELEQR